MVPFSVRPFGCWVLLVVPSKLVQRSLQPPGASLSIACSYCECGYIDHNVLNVGPWAWSAECLLAPNKPLSARTIRPLQRGPCSRGQWRIYIYICYVYSYTWTKIISISLSPPCSSPGWCRKRKRPAAESLAPSSAPSQKLQLRSTTSGAARRRQAKEKAAATGTPSDKVAGLEAPQREHTVISNADVTTSSNVT